MRAFCWNNNNTNNTFKQALNYLKNTFKTFREKYIDKFQRDPDGMPFYTISLPTSTFFSSAGKNL